jgi:hypothetical protein
VQSGARSLGYVWGAGHRGTLSAGRSLDQVVGAAPLISLQRPPRPVCFSDQPYTASTALGYPRGGAGRGSERSAIGMHCRKRRLPAWSDRARLASVLVAVLLAALLPAASAAGATDPRASIGQVSLDAQAQAGVRSEQATLQRTSEVPRFLPFTTRDIGFILGSGCLLLGFGVILQLGLRADRRRARSAAAPAVRARRVAAGGGSIR